MKTYAGIPEENATLENSKVMLVTVPYDGTSTWGKGADKGPELFLDASENMELYDIETGTEPYLEGVYLAGEISENSSPEPNVPDATVTGFFHSTPAIFTLMFIRFPPP